MVMNDSDSSFVAIRMQEAIGIIQSEYVRPSVMFRPNVVKFRESWRANYGDVHAIGNTPDEAMRNFDKLWTTK